MTRTSNRASRSPESSSGPLVWTTRQAVRAFSWSRFLMLLALLTTQLLTLLGVLWVSHMNSERVVRLQAQTSLEQLVRITTDSTSNYLRTAANIVQVNKTLLQSSPSAQLEGEQLNLALQGIVNAIPQTSGAMVGQSDGSFTFVRRDGQDRFIREISTQPTRRVLDTTIRANGQKTVKVVQNPYDPRTRPWFKQAVAAPGKTVWTEPYIFASSRLPGITVASTIQTGPNPAVVAVDVQLRGLTQFLQNLKTSPNGQAFIVDEEGQAIAASHAWPVQMQDRIPLLSEVADPPLQALLGKNGRLPVADKQAQLLQYSVNGQRYGAVLSSFDVQPGMSWTIGVYAPESDFTSDLTRLYRQQLWVIMLIMLVSAGLAWPLAFQATRPLSTLQQQASTDALTGLRNRASFLSHLRESLEEAFEAHNELGVVILDLDGFKAINDTFGHAVGDEVLAAIGKRLQAAVRSGDVLSRLGGDEFAFLIRGRTREVVKLRAEGIIHDIIQQTITIKGIDHQLGATAGLAFREEYRKEGSEALVARADRALLRGKRQGKGRVWISGESGSTLLD